MQQTERLYFSDSNLLEFDALVLEATPWGCGDRVILNRTAFYPTGGGQPNDIGSLGDARVVDVFEDDLGIIAHEVEPGGLLRPGQQVRGAVDRRRRKDHLQQHSGQHILSQAFIKTCGAETRSFHLGVSASTIDIELRTPTEESIQATESLANEIVLENRPMRIHLLTEDEAGRLPLRKETEVRGIVRVIEIEDFDWTPCGGTHASRTGEIGMVAVRSFARVKGMTRVEFVCGYRALNDYRRAHGAATAVARLFSAERESIPELVAKSIDENRSLRKRISRLAALALVPEAQELLSTAIAATGFKVVAATFQQREREEMRALATKLVQLEPCVVLLCATDEAGVRLVYARTSSLTPDMSSLMAESCRLLNGRGGGKPDLAQGGGPDRDRLDDALGFAMKRVLDGPG